MMLTQRMKRFLVSLLCCVVAVSSGMLRAQDGPQEVTLSGSLQTDMLFPEVDTLIGTPDHYDANFLSNTFLDLTLNSQYVTAGARLELLNNPLPGFENAYAGAGIPHFYVTGRYKMAELTVGDFYEQFGSGFILRSYEDRPLAIDNALRGARLTVNPYKGIRIKALGGMQRKYWNFNSSNGFGFDYTKGAVMGADLELSFEEWIPKMMENDYRLLFGASYVSKYEPETDIYFGGADGLQRLNLPEFVGAADFRINFSKGGWNVLAEYAYKANDPSFDNGYIYKTGSAVMLSASYSQRGMSFLLQAKRRDNMSFRSSRSQSGSAAFINNLPAFSMTHTYALAAMYPYATQPDGEWAFQAEARYNFKRGTPLGGKYGTNTRITASYIHSLKKEYIRGVDGIYQGTDGYTSPFFGFGDDVYYLDVNVEISKKLHRTFQFTAMYMYQIYNQAVVEGHAYKPELGDLVKSNIAILEMTYKPISKVGMRMELQYLHTKQDRGQWVYGLYELSLFHNLMIEISDMYNIDETKQHYYKASVAYSWGAHRVQVAYGRTRAGYNCSGGVCRYVPASKGLTVSYNVNF